MTTSPKRAWLLGAALAALCGTPCLPTSARAAPVAPFLSAEDPLPKSSPGIEPLRLGMAAARRGDLETAEAEFKRARSADPKLQEAAIGLAETALRRGQIAAAEGYARDASAAGGNARGWVALGVVLAHAGKTADAEQALRRAVSIDASSLPAHLHLGELLLRTRPKASEAIEILQKAVRLAPNEAGAHYALGTALASDKQYQAATLAIERAAALAPNDPVPTHVLGRLLAAQGRLEEALKPLSRVVDIDPKFLPALLDRADVRAELGRDAEAHADYSKVLAQQPRDAQVRLKLGVVSQRMQRFDEAEQHYKEALRLRDDLALAYNNLAWLELVRQRNLDRAVEWSRKAVALASQVPQFMDTLGWILRSKGDLAGAKAALESAAALSPPLAAAHYHLGIVHQEQGNVAAARTALNRALRIDAKFADAADARRRLEQLRGN